MQVEQAVSDQLRVQLGQVLVGLAEGDHELVPDQIVLNTQQLGVVVVRSRAQDRLGDQFRRLIVDFHVLRESSSSRR